MSNNNAKILSEPVSYQELMSIKNLKVTGIYKIENLVNHKVYIGQSIDIIKRLKDHIKFDIKYSSESHLSRAFIQYGFDNFSFEIIKETSDLDFWEIFLIQLYNSTDTNLGYNIAIGGQGGNLGPEVNKRISERLKEVYSNPEYRKRRSELKTKWWKEVGLTDEQRQKWSEAQKGKTLSDEHKESISKGIRNSSKFKEAISSEERKRKVSEKLKGRHLSKEQCEKISQSKKGKPAHNKGLKWFTNGVINVIREECPENFRPGITNANCISEEEKERRLQLIKENEKLAIKQKEESVNRQIQEYNSHELHWYNNGVKNTLAKECPEGYVPGRLGNFSYTEKYKQKKRDYEKNLTLEQRKARSEKISKALTGHHFTEERKKHIGDGNRGRKYFNNGEIEVMRYECPPGFVLGRCPKAKAAIKSGMT